MIAATRPPDEPERLQKLRSTGLLDSEPEAPFESAGKLACLSCNTPVALVSLVAEDRQWFKARVGIEAIQTGRNEAFCAHAITMDEPLVGEECHARIHAGPIAFASTHRFRVVSGAHISYSPRRRTARQVPDARAHRWRLTHRGIAVALPRLRNECCRSTSRRHVPIAQPT